MKRTALLLGAAVLGSLLAAPPALAAPAVKTAVAQVKASPAGRAGACPTTVGFSAVVAAKGKGVVRYRWVRGDGSKSAIKSFRVSGARKVTVRDRQTFDRDVSGWQAVEVLGKRGLSAKARFTVACDGPSKVWDAAHPLPAGPGAALVAAADVDVSPAAYSGACPAKVTFTGTIQVSRTPAKVHYRWIDSVTGEGRPESLYFAAGGPRVRQVTLPVSVGSSVSGWKAVHLLGPRGHDSGRAAYRVTCRSGPAPTPTSRPTSTPTTTPTPSPTSTPTATPTTTPTATPTSTPTSTPTVTPTTTPTGPPPAQKPVPRIDTLTPGDYEGSCAEPVAYEATGRIELPAGAAQTISYWWVVDGVKGQTFTADFPAGDQPRSQNTSAVWNTKVEGGHTVALMADGAAASAERKFTLTCAADPDAAKVVIHDLLTPLYKGDCTTYYALSASARVVSDRDTVISYRVVVDGKPGVTRTADLVAGRLLSIGDFWYDWTKETKTGKVRIELLDQNKAAREAPYSRTCATQTPETGTVRFASFRPMATYGDCTQDPYPTAHATLVATAGTEITFRWVIDGKPSEEHTYKTGQGGFLELQAFHWHGKPKPGGVVRLEVLNHNKPAVEADYPVHCQS